MWFGIFTLALAVMLLVFGGRGIHRDFSERRWAWGTFGVVATFGGTIALIVLGLIIGSAVGGP